MLPQGHEVRDDTDRCGYDLLPVADRTYGGLPSQGLTEGHASARAGC
jgi:hypothetical protein